MLHDLVDSRLGCLPPLVIALCLAAAPASRAEPPSGQLWPFYGPDRAEPPPEPAEPPVEIRSDAPPLEPDKRTPEPAPRRSASIGLHLMPLTGTVALADPRSGRRFAPAIGGLGLSGAWCFALGAAFDLELRAGVDLAAGTTAGLDDISELFGSGTVGLDSGSAFIITLASGVAVLSDYVGLGLDYGHRWDTITITSVGAQVESFEHDGGALGVRLVAGYGLRSSELRLLAELGYFFRDAGGEAPAFRAALRFELGAITIAGAYESLFAVSGSAVPHARRSAAVSLGVQAVF